LFENPFELIFTYYIRHFPVYSSILDTRFYYETFDKIFVFEYFAVFFRRTLAFLIIIDYNNVVVIPLITSLISNPNTPFEQNKLLPCSLFCFLYKPDRWSEALRGRTFFQICRVFGIFRPGRAAEG